MPNFLANFVSKIPILIFYLASLQSYIEKYVEIIRINFIFRIAKNNNNNCFASIKNKIIQLLTNNILFVRFNMYVYTHSRYVGNVRMGYRFRVNDLSDKILLEET